MKMARWSSISKVLWALGLLTTFLVMRYKWMERPSNEVIKTIESDGMGYYIYLPTVFIYGDFSYRYLKTDLQKKPAYFKEAKEKLVTGSDGRLFTRYYIGTALLQMPFFASAHLAAISTDYPADGFSLPYQWGIALAALAYFLLGIWLSYRVCLFFGIHKYHAATAAFLVGAGTNLLNYVWKEPAFSHVYVFALVAAFFYVWTRFLSKPQSKTLLALLVIYTLILITRPTSGLCVLALPVFAGRLPSFSEFTAFIRIHLRVLLFGGLAAGLLIGLQLLCYYLQTGAISLVSYEGENLFDFARPAFYNFLFGFRKGWFIYTPMAALAFFGLRHPFFKNKISLYLLLIFYIAAVWVLSSWWNWWYGGSFGMRAMTDFYTLTIVLLAFALSASKNMGRWLLLGAGLFFVFLNISQNLQYFRNILFYDGMTEAKYSKIFLNPSNTLDWSTAPVNSECAFVHFSEISTKCVENTKSAVRENQQDLKKYPLGHPHQSYGTFEEISETHPYSKALVFSTDSRGQHAVSFEILLKMPRPDMEALWVVSGKVNGLQTFWQSVPLNRILDNYKIPSLISHCAMLPVPLVGPTEITCYVLNKDREPIQIFRHCAHLKI
jgi:hypothetical protein